MIVLRFTTDTTMLLGLYFSRLYPPFHHPTKRTIICLPLTHVIYHFLRLRLHSRIGACYIEHPPVLPYPKPGNLLGIA